MDKIKLVFGIHNHQPVGNFDYVFEWAYKDCYLPFLEVIGEYPEIPVGLHYSGPLLDWIEANHPGYFEKLSRIGSAGKIEFIGGGYYEPVLPMIPEWDRLGQLNMMSEYIREKFGSCPRGMWLTERVWEQSLASSIAKSGLEYTIVDDSHFKAAGIKDEDLYGYYLTEDQGYLFNVFCSSEYLRYSIPFAEVNTIIDELLRLRDKGKELIVYGDDGEKFGVWPGTNKHVYKDGWLRAFFDALMKHKDDIEIITFSEAIDTLKPKDKVYIPNASYREMMEWVLPVEEREKYDRLIAHFKGTEDEELIKHMIRGGFWRNFLSRYSESSDMYSRMMQVSKRLRNLEKKKKLFQEAKKKLYMSQCNCPYWHGVFGGLYLNHLRYATYKNIIEADYIIEKETHKAENWLNIRSGDFDLDGYDEISMSNEKVKLYIKPDEGGMVYEFDVLRKGLNVLDTMTRQKEYYHKEVAEATDAEADGEESIHDLKRAKEKGLEKEIVYDWYRRKSFIDHLFLPDVTLESLKKNTFWDKGSFVTGKYDFSINKKRNNVSVDLEKKGVIYGDDRERDFYLKKIFTINKESGIITADYLLRNDDDAAVNLLFGVEFNFALLTGDAEDRFYEYESVKRKLGESFRTDDIREIGIEDQWMGIRFDLKFSKPASIFAFPIHTISQSESGFEKVYQSSAVIPVWKLDLKPGESVEFKIYIDVIEK